MSGNAMTIICGPRGAGQQHDRCPEPHARPRSLSKKNPDGVGADGQGNESAFERARVRQQQQTERHQHSIPRPALRASLAAAPSNRQPPSIATGPPQYALPK